MQKAKAEATSPIVRELIRLEGQFLTPAIESVEPSLIEPELSQVSSETPKTSKVILIILEVMIMLRRNLLHFSGL